MSEAVSRAIRMLSDEPLTLGVPLHCATAGMVPSLLFVGGVACAAGTRG